MAEKLLKKNDKNNDIDTDDVYKIDFGQDAEIQENKKMNQEDSRKRTKKNIIKVVDDTEDDDEIDDIFGNINKWIKEDKLEDDVEEIKAKEKKKRLTKIEDGIKSSKKKTKTVENKVKKSKTKEKKQEEKKETEVQNEAGEIKIHAENGITEVLLKHNYYKIELQKVEYDIYTESSDTSYIIVRDPVLRIVSDEVYIELKKQGEDYEVTTNQDFKINYIIDNLERKDNTVNFKLTNLTQITANEEGLNFEIDEEKVIENNLEDNHTLIISEEEGKVYLPYTKEDVKKQIANNKGTKISEVIENNYVLPIDKYKNSIKARFREGYNLMYKKEGKSKRSAIMLGIELMFETNLHPAIISACKNLEELDIYLDCLDDNELEKFSCFKIIYKSLPKIRKKMKFQEF